MTMPIEEVLHGLTAHRAAADGVIGAVATTMPWWIDRLHGPAQDLIFWGTVVLVIGRLILLALDLRDRFGGRARPVKVFTGEHFDRDRPPKP